MFIDLLVPKLALLPPLVVVNPKGRVAAVSVAIERRSGSISGPVAVARSVSGSGIAKVLGCRTGDELLRVLRLGGTAGSQYQVVDPEVDQGHDARHNGQPLVGALPGLQVGVLLIPSQSNQSSKAFAWWDQEKGINNCLDLFQLLRMH